jgi:hypothetical protein
VPYCVLAGRQGAEMKKILALVLFVVFMVCGSQAQAQAGWRGWIGHQYVVCHVSPDDPGNPTTITVRGLLALAYHLRHDDTIGECPESDPKTALLFVGHGEPRTAPDGDIPIMFPDGEPFGPHAESLGVPESAQYTEWAAAYEEISTAMTYIFGDINRNGILHEVAIYPDGDVPDFFVWPAFHGQVYQQYAACENYSPHNDSIREHVESLEINACGEEVDIFLAYLELRRAGGHPHVAGRLDPHPGGHRPARRVCRPDRGHGNHRGRAVLRGALHAA